MIERFRNRWIIGAAVNGGRPSMALKRKRFAGLQPPSIAPQPPNSKARPARFALSGPLIALACTLWLLSACTGAAQAPTFLPTPATTAPTPAPPEAVTSEADEALPALIRVERQASIQGDLAMLAQLWAPDSRIVDGRNTSTPDDDYVWDGRDAVLDRYALAVFPNPPPPLPTPDGLDDLAVQVKGDEATAVNGVDRWRMVYANGRWWLQELIYQQP
jgi:hypothetical protein